MRKVALLCLLHILMVLCPGCNMPMAKKMKAFQDYTLDYDATIDAGLQTKLERIDSSLRARHGMTTNQTSVGLLDLRTMRLAMINPDRGEYAASIPKIGILLAWFHKNGEAAINLDPQTKHELGLMIKASSNEMASKFSRELGLMQIQEVLNEYGFYHADRGGGLWIGKHYGQGGERRGDPLGDNSHAATVRQLLRFYLLLEQEKLVSPVSSRTMRQIFESPEIPHDPIKFVKGLEGRPVQLIRKWGSWQDWLHDSAVVQAENKHYILVALIHHPAGDQYLEELSRAVDEILGT